MIALLLPADDDPRACVEAVVGRLASASPRLDISAGVSACATGIGALPEAYAEAQVALNAAPTEDGCSRVAVLDELGIMRFLLAPGDRGDLRDMRGASSAACSTTTATIRATSRATVETYLANDCSLQRTAAVMFVHAKTIRYRLDKVQAMTGLDFARQDDRFEAQLAISILRTFDLQEVAAS